MATVKVKLVKSTIGALPKHRKTIEALGLKKIGQVVEKQDNPQMRGMVNQVCHLVEIVE
ncbi:50S ribosomal protein L30 [Fusibacter paucivorans]|uniref:Large ribosomal subunit protein uL30 n=1 Tax=Fusibacter paucivorans TaxID=76009 RepID=A0ABS5PVL6_9FIRM|nr:50S ribosomal protein L30 [Fusibacter paucivorans]MBS7528212.1 50S ribosomal protein L30 [Fusibacter paucivorans]